MTTSSQSQFTINGVIDTDKTVMQNMQILASACGSWVTFDTNAGLWSVVINRAGSSVKSFTDDNIIGSITVSGTGLNELYNSVQLSFPHKDLNDQVDYITYSIPTEDRFPNEFENQLNIEFDCVNNPVQAELLAVRELKQSRVDKIIQFRTDYTSLGLKAGDLIDVTSTMLGYTNKMFRIVTIAEEDGDDNVIALSITALEYDADVYDTSGLERQERSTQNGIISKYSNTTVTSSDNQSSLKVSTSSAASSQGLGMLFAANTGLWVLNQAGKLLTMPSYGGNAIGAVIAWTFDSGSDLDIRCRIIYPSLGQNTVDDYLGYTGGTSTNSWPATGTAIITWGGDNTGTGEETVLVDIGAFKTRYPTQPRIIVECRGNWYGTAGSTPVKLSADLYQGGSFSASGYSFTNSGYSAKRSVSGLDVYVNSNEGSGGAGATTLGDLMGYFVYDIQNNTAQFTNDISYL